MLESAISNVDISVCIPSYLRFDKLLRCINSFHSNSSNEYIIEFIICINNDDYSYVNISNYLEHISFKIVTVNKSNFPHYYKKCFELSSGRKILFINDDMVCLTQYWDKLLINLIISDNHIYFPDDGYSRGEVPTIQIYTRNFLINYINFVLPNNFIRHYLDVYLFDVAFYFNLNLCYLSNILILHEHYNFNYVKSDLSYRENFRHFDFFSYMNNIVNNNYEPDFVYSDSIFIYNHSNIYSLLILFFRFILATKLKFKIRVKVIFSGLYYIFINKIRLNFLQIFFKRS